MRLRTRSVVALVAVVLLWSGAVAQGQQTGPARPEVRRLADVLQDLQGRGLKIIFSSEVVRADMRVEAEPRAGSLRRILDDALAQHGLIARDGPGGTVLVVKNPRARLARTPIPQTSQTPPDRSATAVASPSRESLDPPRFEETIDVTGAESRAAVGGPPPRTVRPLEARGLPGGFENIFRALQALPGVTGTDELGSRIAVRGGSPDQNLTVMDGIEIHNPFRLVIAAEDLAVVGLASTFNADTLESVDLFPGAFDVRYGDRLSSLLVVKNREGSETDTFQGSSSLSLSDANVILEGTLPRRASGSWLVSARRTYLGLAAEQLIDTKLPSFQDLHARVSWRPRPRQRVAFVGLAGGEQTRPGSGAADAGYTTKTQNNLVALTFESSVGRVAASRTVASFSHLSDRLNAYERSFDNSRGANTPDGIATGGLLEFQISRDVAVHDFAVRQEFVVTPSSRHWLDLGAEAHGLDARWMWRIAGDRSQQQANGSSIRLGASLPDRLDSSLDSHRFGVWVQDRWQVSPRLTLQPGLRVDRSSLTRQSVVSPRVSGSLILGRAWRLDAAVRLHSQSPGYEKMLQSDYFIDLSERTASPIKAERALHAVAGLQRSFGGGVSARVETYYKRFSDLLVGRLETDAERTVRLEGYDIPAVLSASVSSQAQITTVPLNGATGQAYGVEAQVAHAGGRAGAPLTGWATYSFGRANRTAYGVTHPFDYDRRHAVSATVNLKIGPRMDLAATGRWATGLPRTPVRGVRLALVTDAGDVDGDGNRDERLPQRDALGNAVFQPDLGGVDNINTARLPRFARLDARLAYRPSWSGERWAFYVDLINLLNAKNVAQIDSALVFNPASDRPGIVELAQDRGIPFFPSFGIRFWF
jgi:hypothetical protein